MARPTLSMVGIQSPLDVGSDRPRPAPAEALLDAPPAVDAAALAASRAPRRRTGSGSESPSRLEQRPAHAFYASGRPIVETAMALDPPLVERLGELSRASGRSVNALALAALEVGLPSSASAALDAIVAEQRARVGATDRRLRMTLRLPDDLRARIDELASPALEQLSRGARTDLINAALEAALPEDAYAAAALVDERARRLLDERAGLVPAG